MNNLPPFPNSAEDEPEDDQPEYTTYDDNDSRDEGEAVPNHEQEAPRTLEEVRIERAKAKLVDTINDVRGDAGTLGPIFSRAEVGELVGAPVTIDEFDIISQTIDRYIMLSLIHSGIIAMIVREAYGTIHHD